MFRRLLVLSVIGLLTFAPTASAQKVARKLRIASGTVDKVDYEEKQFTLTGLKGPKQTDDIALTVKRSTKGLDLVKAGAQVTVLYDELDHVAVQVRVSGEDADKGDTKDPKNAVAADAKKSEKTALAGKKSKSNQRSSSGGGASMGPVAPPFGAFTTSFNPKSNMPLGSGGGSGAESMSGPEPPAADPSAGADGGVPANPGNTGMDPGTGEPGSGDAEPPGDMPPGDAEPPAPGGASPSPGAPPPVTGTPAAPPPPRDNRPPPTRST